MVRIPTFMKYFWEESGGHVSAQALLQPRHANATFRVQPFPPLRSGRTCSRLLDVEITSTKIKIKNKYTI